MGMNAELLAIGKYSKDIADFLCYPANFYEDTPDGSTIITLVCVCTNTDGSKLLAKSLGIDPWKFEQHCEIIPENVDFDMMTEAIEDPDDVVVFSALCSAGFKFYYLPNG